MSEKIRRNKGEKYIQIGESKNRKEGIKEETK
jgi:hypothetical protein